jgi:tRNA pseudouridine65 synthase
VTDLDLAGPAVPCRPPGAAGAVGLGDPAIRLPLLYSDAAIAAFDKPSGLLVHRGWGDDAVTATDLAREALGEAVSPAHRIDRATSGVLLFARSSEVAARLAAAFEAGAVEKVYLALVRGSPPDEGTVDHPIPRREDGPRVPAVTTFRTLFRVAAGDAGEGANEGAAASLPADVRRASLVEVRPRTGRLHQVRRHMKHLSHPLIGDANYGKGALNRAFAAAVGLRRLALHAASLRLSHPVTGAPLCLTAELPPDLTGPFERLGIPSSAWRRE